MDAKRWADPSVVDGSLFNGDACEDDQVDGVRDQADAVASALSDVGLMPAAVQPMIVLVAQDLQPLDLRGVTIVGAAQLQTALVRLSGRLTSEEIPRVVAALDASCPPRSAAAAQTQRVCSDWNLPRTGRCSRPAGLP